MKILQTPPKFKLGSFLKTSSIVFILLIGVKLLNFLKKILIGKLFGVSWNADAFFAASYLPYYMAIFFEGVLFLGFLPLFSKVMSEKGKREAQQFAGEIFFLVLALTSILALIFWLASPWFIQQLVPGFRLNQQELTQVLFRILSLVIILISLSSFFKALNSYFGHYVYASSSAIVDTLVMIAVTVVSYQLFGIRGAAWGAVLGAFAAVCQQGFYLLKKESFRLRLSFQTAGLKTLFLFLIPLGIIWGLQLVPLLILNRFGSGMWEGTISALTLSQGMTTVPMGLVSHTVLLAIFPFMAKQANEPNPDEVRQTFFQTMRGAFFILIPTGFLLSAFSKPLALLFFSGGGISEEGTKRVANSLACFGWATFSLYADLFMTQSLIAVRKTLPAIILCATRALLTYGACYLLSSQWDYQGLAFGFSLALVLNFLILFPLVFRMSPYAGGWKSLFIYSAKLIAASLPMFLMAWLVQHWAVFSWMQVSKIGMVCLIVVGSFAGAIIYLALLSILKIKEIRLLVRQIREGWNRRGIFLPSQGE